LAGFILHILKDMILAGYWLNFRVKTGQRQDSIHCSVLLLSCAKSHM